MNPSIPGNIVVVGAGGSGISALIWLLTILGYRNIIAIDQNDGPVMQGYDRNHVTTIIGHGKYEVQFEDFVIYSDIKAIVNGPEITTSRAHQANPTRKHYHRAFSYNEFLAELSKYFRTVAITGSNGKSSTTGLMIHLMQQQCPDFGLGIIGTPIPQYDNRNVIINPDHTQTLGAVITAILTNKLVTNDTDLKRLFLVVEACEYRDHMHMLDIDWAMTTTITRDHHDYFRTAEQYHQSFVRLTEHIRHHHIITDSAWSVISTSGESGKSLAGDSKTSTNSRSIIELDKVSPRPWTHIRGEHRDINATLCETMLQQICTHYGYTYPSPQAIAESWSSFGGLARRMEHIGENKKNGTKTIVFSDYGHHYDAIRYAIRALRTRFPSAHITAFREPHQASRVVHERDQLIETVSAVDTLIIDRLYTAREDFDDLVGDIQENLKKKNTKKSTDLSDRVVDMIASVHDFDEIGEVFGAQAGGQYFADNTQAIEALDTHCDTMNTKDQTHVVVCFSAGGADQRIRHWRENK